jgi:hypothetical protein
MRRLLFAIRGRHDRALRLIDAMIDYSVGHVCNVTTSGINGRHDGHLAKVTYDLPILFSTGFYK